MIKYCLFKYLEIALKICFAFRLKTIRGERESDVLWGTITRHCPIKPRQSMAIFRFLKPIIKDRRGFYSRLIFKYLKNN